MYKLCINLPPFLSLSSSFSSFHTFYFYYYFFLSLSLNIYIIYSVRISVRISVRSVKFLLQQKPFSLNLLREKLKLLFQPTYYYHCLGLQRIIFSRFYIDYLAIIFPNNAIKTILHKFDQII